MLGGFVKDMLLAIDVGNTQTVIGIYDGDALQRMWRISTRVSLTADELHVTLRGLFDAVGVSKRDIHGIALATVVPKLTTLWKQVGHDMFGIEVLCASTKTAGNLIDLSKYGSPDLGADRIADAVAARSLYGAPVIVVDFGTATNIEIIDKDGCFAGGIIAPGVETSTNALFAKAALLPAVELVDPETAIGLNTVKAMQVGIVYGEVDRVDGLVRRIWDQLGYETNVIATGGLGPAIGSLCQTIATVNSELTLHGLRIIYDACNE